MPHKIAIISSQKWAGKIKEDVWLKEALEAKGCFVDIVAWDNHQVRWSSYDVGVLRSAWGYHKDLKLFKDTLNMMQASGMKLINDYDIVRWNIHKEKQLISLMTSGVEIVPSFFIFNKERDNTPKAFITSTAEDLKETIKDIALINGWNVVVVKPTVSGSGDDTYIVDVNGNTYSKGNNVLTLDETTKLYPVLSRGDNEVGLIVQPFIPEIEQGEISAIHIGGILTHIIKKYPTVLREGQDPQEIAAPDYRLTAFVDNVFNKVHDILKKETNIGAIPTYSRTDFVDTQNNGLQVMELELAEPDLLIKRISNTNSREKVINLLANNLLQKVR